MRLLSFLLLWAPLSSWAQPPAQGLLWRVEGPAGGRASYVLGTVHSRDARAFGQVPQVLGAMRGLDGVAGELDLTDAALPSLSLAMAMMMPDGQQLADLYTGRQWKQVQEAIAEHLGPVAVMAGRMKPFFLMSLLSESAMRTDSAMVLDQYLQVKAREMGLETLGLETLEEQLAAVDDLPLKEQAGMLLQLVRNGLYAADMDSMMEAYAAQDLGRLTRIASLGGLSDGFNERLLTARNQVMAQRADSLMQADKALLFAVGAAHLPGADGVLERLRRMGYAVEPVPAPAPMPALRPETGP